MYSRIGRTALGAALAIAIANPALAAKPVNACTDVPGALPGSSLVYFTGEAITNIVNNPAPVDIAPNTLGTATIATTDHKIRLTCGIRGTIVNATPTPTGIDAVFLSHAVCADHSQLDFNVQTTVTFTLPPSAACPGGVGNVHEEGDILGSVGTVRGTVGRIELNGISACGLQELAIKGFLCLTAEQQSALKDLKNE